MSEISVEQVLHLLQAGDEGACLALAADALGEPVTSPAVLHAVGVLVLGGGDRAGAERLLRRAVEVERPAAAHLNDLGVLLFEQARMCEAAECFMHALSLEAGLVSAQQNLTEVLSALRAQRFTLHAMRWDGDEVALGSEIPAAWQAAWPVPAQSLWHGLRTAEDGNFPTALAWLNECAPVQLNDCSCTLVPGGSGQMSLQLAAAPGQVQALAAVLLALAFCCRSESVAVAAVASLLRLRLAAGQRRSAERLEQLFLMEWPAQQRLLQHMRACALPPLVACGRHKRQKFMLIGTCIAEGVRYFLNSSPQFRSRYILQHFITNRAARSMAEFVIDDAALGAASVIAHVHPVWADWGNEQAYVDLLARVPAGVQCISWPYPVFQPLWPFHCRDSRNEHNLPEPFQRPFEERSYFPYGDSMLLGLLRQHGKAEAAVEAYLAANLAAEINLDHLLVRTLDIMREKEAHTDVKIVDFIEQNFRTRKLFDSVNHLSNLGMLQIANQILQKLDLPPVDEGLLLGMGDILSPQMPIHPAVLRHFGLSYADERTRYATTPHLQQTVVEYLRDYAHFT